MPEQSPLKTPVKSPAIDKALAWIRLRIANGVWQPGDTLPSLHALALTAGVARFTMWKAVGLLKKEGLLITKRGSGIIIGGNDDILQKQSGSWQNLEKQIATAIYDGEFPAGSSLPPQSKLQIRFTAAYRTLNKALVSLQQKRILTRNGSRFLVPYSQTTAPLLEVVLFNEGVVEANEGSGAVVRLSEEKAHKLGLRLIRYEHSYSTSFNGVELQRLISRETVSGFVVDFWGVDTPDRISIFQFLVSALYAARKPIAIVDHVSGLKLPEPLKSSKRVLTLIVAGRVAGEDIGRYLLNAGHRRAAFLTHKEHESWSQQRFAGLKNAFTSSGRPDCEIILAATAPLPDTQTLVCAAAHLSRTQMLGLFPDLSPSLQEYWFAAASQAQKILSFDKSFIEKVRCQVKGITEVFRNGGNLELAQKLRGDLFSYTGGKIQDQNLWPMFAKVVQDHSITAWIGATDGIALAARAFLMNKSIDTPRKISLCGFDNMIGAAAQNLTSYDFDLSAMMHQAFSFASGRTDPARRLQRVIEWPGILYERQSSGKASRTGLS